MNMSEYIGRWMYEDGEFSHNRLVEDLVYIIQAPDEFDFTYKEALEKASNISGLTGMEKNIARIIKMSDTEIEDAREN